MVKPAEREKASMLRLLMEIIKDPDRKSLLTITKDLSPWVYIIVNSLVTTFPDTYSKKANQILKIIFRMIFYIMELSLF